ncbi:hypothetical protein L1987_24123 [Smallanthus sonchifolius]|uniref:Uncharacterized protein n=1 Tax=Smallanthus sonchifolius TaxID=185202 RepID=A0ACB9IJC2_9ASTR|nr:hypothetical protein L1987_24123 [Smallanthus sonchifolius]
MFNTAAGGHIMERLELDQCEEMFESFAQAEKQHPRSVRNSIPTARAPASSPRGVHQVTPETRVVVALASMANEIKELKLSTQRCQVCSGDHNTRDYPINNQEHLAFQDLQRTVGDITQSLNGIQGGPSSSPNASVMAVSVRSVERKEVVEDDSHSIEYGIPSVEEVKKVDWKPRFAAIDAKMSEELYMEEILEEPVGEKEPVDERVVQEKPVKKA